MAKLDARYMETGLKKGWTLEDFCHDLQIDEKRFKELLNKFFKERLVKSYKKRMESNGKVKTRTNRENHESNSISDFAQANMPHEEKTPLEILKQREKELREFLFKTEADTQELSSKKRAYKEKLRTSQELLNNILKQLQNEETKINSLIDKLETTESEIQILNLNISKARKNLSFVTEEIEKLDVIEITYTEDGKIICDETIPEIQYDDFMQKLLNDNLLEDLTLKDLKITAKLFAISKLLKDTTGRKTKINVPDNTTLSVAIELAAEIIDD